MKVLVVHPEVKPLGHLVMKLKGMGITPVRTCHLTAAIAYCYQLKPDVLVVGQSDVYRDLPLADFLAACLKYPVRAMVLPLADLTVVYRAGIDRGLIAQMRASLADRDAA